MSQVQFYHLTTTPLERALPKLLEKAYSAGFRAHVVLASEAQVDAINQLLWTYDPDSFLPHGSNKDALPEQQPVFLSTVMDAPNQPDLLCVTQGEVVEKMEAYKRILDIFNGNDAAVVESARERWKSYKGAGCALSYLQQNAQGGWDKQTS